MEKDVKLHTCCRHIQCDEEKSKLKGHGFGFLEKGIDCTQSFMSQFSGIGWLLLWIYTCWERISPLKITGNFKTWKEIVTLSVNVVISISTRVKNHPSIKLVLHLCGIAYRIREVNLYALLARWDNSQSHPTAKNTCGLGSVRYRPTRALEFLERLLTQFSRHKLLQ